MHVLCHVQGTQQQNRIGSFYQMTNSVSIEQKQDQVGSPKHGCLGIKFLPSKNLRSEERACEPVISMPNV
jgi:hypothetical protein